MRIRATLGGIFASVAVLVIGWQFGAAAASSHTATTSTGNAGTSTGTSSGGTSSGGASSGGTSSGSLKDGTYDGTSESTRFGNVQVEVVVSGGRITDVKALQLTDDGGRSVQISNYAAPILRSEVLKAQSASVDSVSGATYTTDGYLQSLQSALDKAKA
ncbi:MAG: FMN-binding protein [Microbacteriaceae bacterium]|nr:FMN-binding protein [Microbacteriaceae bacterium]